jgi:hypothetical protein
LTSNLVGRVEAKQAIDAGKGFLRNGTTLYATFLGDDVEQLLESAFKSEDLLYVRILGYKRLHHRETL